MPVLDTTFVSPGDRLDYWQKVVCEQVVSIESTVADEEHFEGRLTTRQLGQFGLALIEASPHAWRRGDTHIHDDARDDMILALIVSGEGALTQFDRTVEPLPGQLVLFDPRHPFRLELRESTIVFRVPRRAINAQFNALEGGMSTLLGEGSLLRDILAQTLMSYFDASASIQNDAAAAHLGAAACEMLLALLDHQSSSLDMASLGEHRADTLDRAKRFMMANLRDPALSSERTCAAIGVSVRTLNRLFAQVGTTPTRWLMLMRLEMTKRDLVEGSSKTVTDAAFRAGFNELSHFSRVFKDHFGVTPRSLLRTTPLSQPKDATCEQEP